MSFNIGYSLTTINSCQNLTAVGETYELNSSIVGGSAVPGSKACLNILANNITVDCKGFTVGGDSSTESGIAAIGESGANIENIVVKNCNVNNWKSSAFGKNINYYYVKNGILENINLTNGYNAVSIWQSDNITTNNIKIDSFSSSFTSVADWGSKNSKFTNFEITNSQWGLENRGTNNHFENISIVNGANFNYGIDNCHTSSFKNLTINGKQQLIFNNPVTIDGWTNFSAAHFCTTADGSIIKNINISTGFKSFNSRVFFFEGASNIVFDNISVSNQGTALTLESVTNSQFTNLNFDDNSNNFKLDRGTSIGNLFENITVNKGSQLGEIERAHDNIFRNIISTSSNFGFILRDTYNNLFENFDISGVSNYGVFWLDDDNKNITIKNGVIKSSGHAVYFWSTNDSKIINLTTHDIFNSAIFFNTNSGPNANNHILNSTFNVRDKVGDPLIEIEHGGGGSDLTGTFNNYFYNNNFENGTINFEELPSLQQNFWNYTLDGYNIGNFWSDLTCNQFEMNGQYGICINPNNYTIESSVNNIDFAPQIDPFKLTSCKDLTIRGGKYYLTQDISATGTCFEFLNDTIELDCKGYTITGDAASNQNGIKIIGENYDNIKVENCNINNFHTAINIERIDNSVFKNLNLNSTTAWLKASYSLVNNTFENINHTKKFFSQSYTEGRFKLKNVKDIILNKYTMSYSDTQITIDGWTNISTLFLYNVDNSIIKNLNIDGIDDKGVYINIVASDDVVFENISISNYYYGIHQYNNNLRNNFTNINIYSSSKGIRNDGSDYANYNNIYSENTNTPIELYWSDYNTINNTKFIGIGSIRTDAAKYNTINNLTSSTLFLSRNSDYNIISNSEITNINMWEQFGARPRYNTFYNNKITSSLVSSNFDMATHINYFNYTHPTFGNLGNYWPGFSCVTQVKQGDFTICSNPNQFQVSGTYTTYDYAPLVMPFSIKYNTQTPEDGLNKFNLTSINLSIIVEGTTMDSCYFMINNVRYDGITLGNTCDYTYNIPLSKIKNTIKFQGFHNLSDSITPLPIRTINSYSQKNITGTSNVPSFGFLSLLISLILIFTFRGVRK